MAAIPARQRENAARLALSAQLPSPRALTCIAWKGTVGHAWIWIDPPAAIEIGDRTWIPESLLAPVPQTDGVRFLALSSGMEGQVWRAGQLTASQWWPALPDDAARGRFLRASGFDQQLDVPPVGPFEWRVEPWAELRRSWLPGTVDAQERLAWVGAAALIALVAGWQLTSLVRWQNASATVARQLEVARADVAPVLAARERAELASEEAARLMELQSGVSDYEMMSQITAALPEGVELVSWRREPERIVTTVRNGPADPRGFVSVFVGRSPLDDVSATPVPAGMQLTFVLSDATQDAAL
ncbi:hypothetical protein [Luteimonas terrae]|uniref:Uncharacterized protein n=1 Tax=Luteimonas terrae TaxID=1530191 RepID=A0A4V6PLT6_9GAMM|nr:hypothetical protein [Luteimonas terrae]TDK29979.1 hypothetical protein E2F49_12295 [Luteimonas terrae]